MNVDWNVMYNARFCGGINVQIVESAEGEVGVEGRGITIVCGMINGHTQIDGEFSIQSFHCPGCENWLSGHIGDADHFFKHPQQSMRAFEEADFQSGD